MLYHRGDKNVTCPERHVLLVRHGNISMQILGVLYRTVPLMCSVHWTLQKQTCLQQSTKAGDVEVWNTQVAAQRVPKITNCRTNHSKSMIGVHVQPNLWPPRVGGHWPNEGAVIWRLGWLTCTARTGSPALGYVDTCTLSRRVYKCTICHIEPVYTSVKELCQTTVVLPCATHHSCCSIHDSL